MPCGDSTANVEGQKEMKSHMIISFRVAGDIVNLANGQGGAIKASPPQPLAR